MTKPDAFLIRLTAPPSRKQTLSVPSTWTLSDLKKEAHRLFPPKRNEDMTLLSGYPPKPLTQAESTLARECVRPNESIMIRFITAVVSNTKKSTTKKTNRQKNNKQDSSATTSSSSPSSSSSSPQQQQSSPQPSPPNSRRPKRAAAITASSTFKDVIAAQNKLQKMESGKSTKKNNINNTTKRKSTRASNKPTKNNISQPNNTAAARHLSTLPGRKLDGSTIKPTTTTPQNQKRIKQLSFGTSESDVATTLLSSVNSGGGNNGAIGSVLRRAMKNAVHQTYNVSRANARFAAVASSSPTALVMTPSSSSPDDDDVPDRLNVAYAKGIEGRGTFRDDHVDLLSREALSAVITAVYHSDEGGNRETLRPRTMALLSPRVFWSLAWHFRQRGEEEQRRTMEEMLSDCCSDLDWSFLKSRERLLSEKALENLRQERGGEEEEVEVEKGVDVVKVVEDAMTKVMEEDTRRMRDRRANAALRRLTKPTTTTTTTEEVNGNETIVTKEEEWRLITPSDLDEDELKDCILGNDDDNDTQPPLIPPSQLTHILQTFLQNNIHNWRELANITSIQTTTLLSHLNNNNNNNPTTTTTPPPPHVTITEDLLESWIDTARLHSLDEIMISICDDNNISIVENLRDKARAGTPKDLALWEEIPGLLRTEAGLDKEDGSGGGVVVVEDETVRGWCQRAKKVCEEWEWVNWYATPVD